MKRQTRREFERAIGSLIELNRELNYNGHDYNGQLIQQIKELQNIRREIITRGLKEEE